MSDRPSRPRRHVVAVVLALVALVSSGAMSARRAHDVAQSHRDGASGIVAPVLYNVRAAPLASAPKVERPKSRLLGGLPEAELAALALVLGLVCQLARALPNGPARQALLRAADPLRGALRAGLQA